INDKESDPLFKKTQGKVQEKVKDTMKEAADKMKDKEKEIDLLEVSGNIANSIKEGSIKIGTFFGKIIKAIMVTFIKLIMLGFNSWKFALIVIALIGGSTFYMYKTSEAYYLSDAYGVSKITGSQEIIQIINSISIPNDELNIALKNDLNLSPEVYNNIKSIKASWLVDENDDGISDFVDYDNDYEFNLQKDSMSRRMTDRFNVRLTLKNQTITNEVQVALGQYLSNHPFIKNLNDSRLSKLQGMINVYANQATVLDSLQTFEYFKVEDQSAIQSLKIGEFELIGQGDEQKEKRLYHENIISLKQNVISNQAVIEYDNAPIVFVGNFTNTTDRANGIVFYAKKAILVIIPFALLLFILLKKPEFEAIFRIKKFLNN
ncbi:MAG: hypothetical protein PF444_00925, partial [Bacteroidales bacterium]|nr:hypothetical protein [Bacteroidales bacterium]